MSDPRIGVKPSACPFCGYAADAATCFENDEARPRPGDFSLCLECAEVLVFDDEVALRKPAAGELEAAPSYIRSALAKGQQAIHLVHKHKGKPSERRKRQ